MADVFDTSWTYYEGGGMLWRRVGARIQAYSPGGKWTDFKHMTLWQLETNTRIVGAAAAQAEGVRLDRAV